jgi:hypothetical protein
VEWPARSGFGGDAQRLRVRDICDVVYVLLLERIERQTLALQQQHAVFRSVSADFDEEWPALDAAQERLDEALSAEFTRSDLSPRDRELYELLGVS